MSATSNLTSLFSRSARVNAFDAWVTAAFDAKVALEIWWTSPDAERAGAYAHYCAALDREERAAGMLAAVAT